MVHYLNIEIRITRWTHKTVYREIGGVAPSVYLNKAAHKGQVSDKEFSIWTG